MRYWFDTEFHEDGRTIDLISIGIVAEDGREYYAVSTDFNQVLAFDHPWLWKNVLPHLPWHPRASGLEFKYGTVREDRTSGHWKSKLEIRKDILDFCDPEQYGKPEFWAYYADYDWVALCQLFGTMMDLPRGWPMYCRDIKQEVDRLQAWWRWFNSTPEYILRLPKQVGDEHHALADARWNRTAWEFLGATNGQAMLDEVKPK